MSEEEPQRDNIRTIIILGIIVFMVGVTLIGLNNLTVDQSMVSAPCDLIKNDSIPLPDNVVTKGYDIVRGNSTMEYTNGEIVTSPTISYECYYIKDAGLIERIIYQWDLYQL